MLKVLTSLTIFMVAASLSAVTVKWDIGNVVSEYSGQDWKSSLVTETGFALVYSQAQLTDAGDGMVWRNLTAAVASGTTEKITLGGTETSLTYADANKFVDSDYNLSATFTGLAGEAATTGYYYLVVFDTTEGKFTDSNTYAVVGGLQYVAGGKNGIYDTLVDGKDPTVGDYVDLNSLITSGSVIVHAPEPTVLALLALGVAGLALRRKNF